MASEIQDLWGDGIATTEMITPVSILRQQASFLGRKTKNLVEAEVTTNPNGQGGFYQDFNLVVPTLGGYKYRLFRLSHGPELYPLAVAEGPPPPPSGIKSEEELLSYLKTVLSSDRTARLVAALKAQAQG